MRSALLIAEGLALRHLGGWVKRSGTGKLIPGLQKARHPVACDLFVKNCVPPLRWHRAQGYQQGMPTVGERLRGERERQKLTVHQVADGTNIKTDHVRALEDANWAVFSAPVYIRGFTRTYARFLRLDDKALVTELDAELGRTAEYSGPPSLVPNRRGPLDAIMLVLSRVRWRWVFPIFLGLAVLGVVAWSVQWWRNRPKSDPMAGLGSGLYQPRFTNSGAILPLPPPPANPRPSVPALGRRGP